MWETTQNLASLEHRVSWPVVGNEAGKVDGGQCTEEFETPNEEARCHSVCRQP